MHPLRILTISFDDSTAFVADNFSFAVRSNDVVVYHALMSWKANADFVESLPPTAPFDFILERRSLYQSEFLSNFDLIFFAKIPPGLAAFCQEADFLHAPNRPWLAAAFPGLEFSPARGFENRLFCDVIIFNTVHDRSVFEALYPHESERKLLVVGNPSILRRFEERGSTPRADGPLAFLTQNITPFSLRGRAQLLRDLTQAAGPHGLVFKVRQKRGANVNHVHQELFPYETIATREGVQVQLVDCSMSEALESHRGFVSCSSTGVIEALAAGKPAAFIATFDGWSSDPLHVAGLAYATRYGVIVEAGQLPHLPQVRQGLLEEDFGLTSPSELCSLLAKLPARYPGRPSQQGRRRVTQEVDALRVAECYRVAGNPHKALFLALRGCIEMGSSPCVQLIARALKDLPDSERLETQVVSPVLNASADTAPTPPHGFAVALRRFRESLSSPMIVNLRDSRERIARKARKLERDPVRFVRDARLLKILRNNVYR